MDFYTTLEQSSEGYSVNPYAAKNNDTGEWISGEISIDFLNANFGQYSTAAEMITATTSEGLQMYFQWLKDQGILS